MLDPAASHRAQRPKQDAETPSIPDHELLRRIGSGAYGDVWLARNVFGDHRAAKIVYRSTFEDDRPFEREFEGIRRFEPISRSHPSQLNILHVGRGEGCFYYVMELADDAGGNPKSEIRNPKETRSPKSEDGIVSTPALRASGFGLASDFGIRNWDFYIPRTLKHDLKRRGRLPPVECVEIGLALTTALAHLHGHGLVHRDIKPSNIIFVGGVPKLADIGLVTDVDASRSFVGTEGFLPPEGPGTPQADLYSLGKVLYEMSTGRDRKDYPALPLDWDALDAAEQARLLELNEVLVKVCEANPRRRYQTAEELRKDLELLRSGQSVLRQRAKEQRLKCVRTFVSTAVLVAMLVIVARFLSTALTNPPRAVEQDSKGTANQEAWDLYQKGRFLVESQSPKEIRTAIEYFQRAMELDPNFARAYEWLGSAYCNLAFHTNVPAREYFTKAELSVRRAIALDPSQAEAWSGLGFIKTKYGTNLPEAERLLRHSLKLDPNNITSLHRLAIFLSDCGRSDEAIALQKKILQADPIRLDFNRSLGLRSFQARRFDDAISALQKTVELHPNNALTWGDLGAALAHVGRYDEAAAALKNAKRLNGATDAEISALTEQYSRIGIKAFWTHEALRPEAAGTNYYKPFGAARLCARVGDYEGAMQWLQRLEDDPFEASRAMLSPEFDPLRSDPRFIGLLKKIGHFEASSQDGWTAW